MKRNVASQKGFSVFMLVAILMFVAFLITLGPKIGMPYYNAELVKKAMQKAAESVPKEAAPVSVQQMVKESVNNRLAIDHVQVTLDDIEIDKDGDKLILSYEHVEKQELWKGAVLTISRPIVIRQTLK